MKLSTAESERLEVLRFPLIVGVVFIHAYGANVGLSSENSGIENISGGAYFVQQFISQGLARLSVPLFFVISGYLFFLGFSLSTDSYLAKIKSRLKTLLVPFLFWNSAILLLLFIAQTIPATKLYFSGENQHIATFSVFDFFNAIFGFNSSPASYQFWFIRDLMIMVLLAPILNWVLNNRLLAKIGLFSILVMWFFGFWPLYCPSGDAFFFFYIGAFCAVNKYSLFTLDKYAPTLSIGYALLLFCDLVTKEQQLNYYIHNLAILVGLISALFLSQLILLRPKLKRALFNLAGYSFFVFAFHEPALITLKKVVYRVVSPQNDALISVLYFMIPITIIVLSIYTYKLLNVMAPNVLKIISGGR